LLAKFNFDPYWFTVISTSHGGYAELYQMCV